MLEPSKEPFQKVPNVDLRKIASLETSEFFTSEEEKIKALQQKSFIKVPAYPDSKEYHTNLLKRLWSRLRYFSAILLQRVSGKDYPLIAVLVVNNKCNWNCAYCFGDYPSRKELDYSTNELKFLIDELYSMGARYLNLHGGEALLRKDIGEICRYVKFKGMYLSLVTNGSLLASRLNDIKIVDNLTISLDGSKENNDRNRGHGSFAKALNAIEIAVEKKLPLRVSATLTKHTMNDIEFLAKLAHEKNFHLYFSILFKPLKKAKDAQMTNDEIRACILEIRRLQKAGFPIFTSEQALEAAFQWPYDFNDKYHVEEKEITRSYSKSHIPCYYGRTKFTIEADGYVYPCFLTTDGTFHPLNWKEVGIKAAIEHVQKKNTCRACPAFTQNDHNLMLGLNLKQVTYLIKDQLKETLRIKNRLK